MDKSNAPKGQGSTAKDSNQSKNRSTAGQDITANQKGAPTQNESNYSDNPHNPSGMRVWLKAHVTPTLVVELLVLLVGIRVACIYSRQLDQMIENNRISREALQSVQRAFVSVNPVPEMQTANVGGSQIMMLNFGMENSGVTPAKSTSAHVNWVKSNKGLPLPTDFNFPDANIDGSQDSTVSVIGPKDRFPLTVGPIPRDFMERLYKREVRLFVYGWVRYNDVFENTPRHSLKFSYELVAIPGIVHLQTGQEGQGLQTLINGPRFNCYDEECNEQAHK